MIRIITIVPPTRLASLVFLTVFLLCCLTYPIFSQTRGSAKSGGGRQKAQRSAAGRSAPSPDFITRQHYVLSNGVDSQYEMKKKHLPPSEANLKAGVTLYQKHCQHCHGSGGRGDGFQSEYIDIAPANLTLKPQLPVSGDTYLFWTISLGGARFNSQMPRFGKSPWSSDQPGRLSETDIWQIITYLDTLAVKSIPVEMPGQKSEPSNGPGSFKQQPGGGKRGKHSSKKPSGSRMDN